MNNPLYISDGVSTETFDNEDERSTVEIARGYAARYDHAGERGWSVGRCFTDDPRDRETIFAFRQGGEFEWRTDREYVCC